MSEAAQHEAQNNTLGIDTDIYAEMCDNVEPLSQAELASFAGLVTLPQAVAPQPAFDSLMQRGDAVYARPAFTSSMQSAEPAINGTPAFSSALQPAEPTFQNGTI
jgi:hypothetical protein